MARKQISHRDVQQAASLLRQIPPKVLVPLALVVLVGVGIYFFANRPATNPAQQPIPEGTVLFCSWNVENFFDDQDDPQNEDSSENFFARHPELFRLKVNHLADALLNMNEGNGPDIMALVEVENESCLNHLRDELNARLEKAGKADKKYEHVLFKPDLSGRRFAPGIVTRLDVDSDRTVRFARSPNTRTLEGHLKVDGRELVILSAHWTSRVDYASSKGSADEPANARRRLSYAQDCYGRFKAILKENPDADVLICGDFNDEFRDPSIRDGLHATSDLNEARNALDEPRPFDLFASWPNDRNPPGTIYGKGRWSIFDHICVSRGLLDDKGWSCDPKTALIFGPPEMRQKSSKEPFRFGDAMATERGFSDHFPVLVQLRIN